PRRRSGPPLGRGTAPGRPPPRRPRRVPLRPAGPGGRRRGGTAGRRRPGPPHPPGGLRPVSSFVRRVAATFAGTVVVLGLLLEAKTGAGPPRNALALGLRTRPVATAPPGQGPTTTEAPPPPPTTVAGVPTTAAAVPSTQATATTTTTHAVARPTTSTITSTA